MSTRQYRERKGPAANLIALVIALPTCAIGAAAILGGIHFGRKPYAIMKTWPKADALVVTSEVAQKDEKDGGTLYWPRVMLQYSVAGKEYTRVADQSGATSSHAAIQKVVDSLPPGTRHLLPYDPAHPQEIYVGAGWDLQTFGLPGFLLLFGLAFILPSLVVILKSLLTLTAGRGGSRARPA
jgi:Protein of unknown function (DUF3592)